MKDDKKVKRTAKAKTKWYDISHLGLDKVAREGMDLESNGKMLRKIIQAKDLHNLTKIQVSCIKESSEYLLDLSEGSKGYIASKVIEEYPELKHYDGLEYNGDFTKAKPCGEYGEEKNTSLYGLVSAVSRKQKSEGETPIDHLLTKEVFKMCGVSSDDNFTDMVDKIMLKISAGDNKLIKKLSELMADKFAQEEPQHFAKCDRNMILSSAVEFLKKWADNHISKKMGVSGGLGKAEA